MKVLFCILLVLATASGAGHAAAEKVGQAIVDGRVVILKSDGTWHFRDEGAQQSGCESISRFSVCLQKNEWSRLPKTADFSAIFSRGNRYYFGIISEPTGSNQGIEENVLQKIILENAARGGNTTVENVTVHDVVDTVNDKLGLRGVVYSVSIGGAPIVYYNAFRVYKDQSVQFVFWMIGTNPEQAFLEVVSNTLDKITREQ
jgi:hypothetical protein